jgi:hypothetical protein
MIRVILVMLVLALPTAVSAQEMDITSADIDRALVADLTHPYLFFTEDEKPAILDRIAGDTGTGEFMDRLLAECNRLLYTPVEPQLPRQLNDSRFDISGTFLTEYSRYRRAALWLAFAYQMTGDERFAEKSFEFADIICDMQTWVMRACQFPKAYRRVSPWNVPADKVMFNFAIVASDTASDMACVYDWLYTYLDKGRRDRIRGALLEKAITRVRGDYDYHWWATAYRCNWCAWCNTGLGLAALTLLTEDPQLTDVVAESYNRISRTYSELGEDGGWAEGIPYWGQTLRMSILFGDALKRCTGGTYNHFKHPKILTDAVSLFMYFSVPPEGKDVGFADAHFYKVGAPRLYNKLALETGNPVAAWLYNNRYNQTSDLFDVIWPRHTVTPALPETASKHFRTVGWVTMRSDFTDPEKVFVACKAGYNNDPHHGHLDVGQFTVNWRGEEFIADIGTAQYDERYFDEEKYDTPHASSRGHNLIFVEGEGQVPGKRFRSSLNESVGGEVVEFRTSDTRDYVVLDPTNAYRNTHLKKWRRHIVLDKPVMTVLVDEVTCFKGSEIEARFHSAVKQDVKDGWLKLDGRLGDMAVVAVSDTAAVFREGRHAYLALMKQANFEWIPYVGSVMGAQAFRSMLAHVIVPVENDAEAEALKASTSCMYTDTGAWRLRFTYRGTKHEYEFVSTPEGFLLPKAGL